MIISINWKKICKYSLLTALAIVSASLGFAASYGCENAIVVIVAMASLALLYMLYNKHRDKKKVEAKIVTLIIFISMFCVVFVHYYFAIGLVLTLVYAFVKAIKIKLAQKKE